MDKYCVKIPSIMWDHEWPEYFTNFYTYCIDVAESNDWNINTVCNYNLKPHGKLIKTNTQGWYLRWDDQMYHTAFILKWS